MGFCVAFFPLIYHLNNRETQLTSHIVKLQNVNACLEKERDKLRADFGAAMQMARSITVPVTLEKCIRSQVLNENVRLVDVDGDNNTQKYAINSAPNNPVQARNQALPTNISGPSWLSTLKGTGKYLQGAVQSVLPALDPKLLTQTIEQPRPRSQTLPASKPTLDETPKDAQQPMTTKNQNTARAESMPPMFPDNSQVTAGPSRSRVDRSSSVPPRPAAKELTTSERVAALTLAAYRSTKIPSASVRRTSSSSDEHLPTYSLRSKAAGSSSDLLSDRINSTPVPK